MEHARQHQGARGLEPFRRSNGEAGDGEPGTAESTEAGVIDDGNVCLALQSLLARGCQLHCQHASRLFADTRLSVGLVTTGCHRFRRLFFCLDDTLFRLLNALFRSVKDKYVCRQRRRVATALPGQPASQKAVRADGRGLCFIVLA